MTEMETIAQVGDWKIVHTIHGLIAIQHGGGAWICNYSSVRDAVVMEVEDMDIRKELMRQWGAWMDKRNKAEVQQ